MSRHRRTQSWWTPARTSLVIVAALTLSLVPTAAFTAPSIMSSNTKADAVKVIKPVNANDDGIKILGLPGIAVQKEEPKPFTFVTTGNAYFGQDGPELTIGFTTQVGSKFTDGQITAKFVGSHPEIKVTGDKSNLVEHWSSYNGLPYLYVSYKHAQDWNLGFSVDFHPDYYYKGGKFAYPAFYTFDGTSMANDCEIAGHTTHFQGGGGGGLDWFGYNALTQEADVSAWYSLTSPEVWVSGGIVRLANLGFVQGEPSAQVDFGKNGWILAGFNRDNPSIVGAPQKSGASC